MLPITFRLIFLFMVICFTGVGGSFAAETKSVPHLRLPVKNLFSHKVHGGLVDKKQVSCTDCHSFAVKSNGFDPLAKNVESGFLAMGSKVCHECHLGKVEGPRVNQCSLCHEEPEKLKPRDHDLAWRQRHGSFAQMNPESCKSCHQENQNSCLQCHAQRNTLKPMVHRPNFRMTHSISARANPASCVACHTNMSTCIQCHKGGFTK